MLSQILGRHKRGRLLNTTLSKVKQADIKANSEIHMIAKEARYGKSPENIIDIPVQELEIPIKNGT